MENTWKIGGEQVDNAWCPFFQVYAGRNAEHVFPQFSEARTFRVAAMRMSRQAFKACRNLCEAGSFCVCGVHLDNAVWLL